MDAIGRKTLLASIGLMNNFSVWIRTKPIRLYYRRSPNLFVYITCSRLSDPFVYISGIHLTHLSILQAVAQSIRLFYRQSPNLYTCVYFRHSLPKQYVYRPRPRTRPIVLIGRTFQSKLKGRPLYLHNLVIARSKLLLADHFGSISTWHYGYLRANLNANSRAGMRARGRMFKT